MYSRAIPESAASTVNTTPDGLWEPCSSPVRNSGPMPGGRQLLAQSGKLDAAAEPFVLVRYEGDRDARVSRDWRTVEALRVNDLSAPRSARQGVRRHP
jgi:hypothetical protein